jgi:hypothetical protein
MPTVSAPASSDADARKRRRENLIIAAVLVFQIAMPLSYYLSGRIYDERFSWRMFSTLRLRDCKVEVKEHLDIHDSDDNQRHTRVRQVNIERDVHVAWLRLLERMRSAVIDEYLARRCESPEVTSVEFACHCNDTDGRPLPPMERSFTCKAAHREASP